MRKKKPPEHENHERWLVSYADFITLLFAFFVVMFAVSQVDAQKMGRFVESVKTAFEYEGVFSNSSPHPIEGGSAGVQAGGRPAVVPPKSTVLSATTGSHGAHGDLRRSLEKMVRGSGLEGKLRIREDERGLTVSLTEAGFFDVGSASMKPDSIPTLRALALMLSESNAPLVVEGHTDDVPIHNFAFRSNWELSTARATSIVAYLIEEMDYDPMRLAAAGYAEYRPIADNSTSEGRAMNRRVDLVVLTEGSGGVPPG